MTRNQRGSANVEAISSIVLLAPLIAAGFVLSYFTFAKVWCDRAAYEGAVCLATLARTSDCESRFRKELRALPIGSASHLRFSKSTNRSQVEFRFGFKSRLKSYRSIERSGFVSRLSSLSFQTRSELELPLTTSDKHWGFF